MSGRWRASYIKEQLFSGCAAHTLLVNMMLPRINWIVRLAGVLRALGPYAAIELVLPGGTLIALAVWAIRRHLAGLHAAPVTAGVQVAAPPRRRLLRTPAAGSETSVR